MSESQSLVLIGWREWIALPDLGVAALKAKVDTGARTSALHALEIEEFQKGATAWVRFRVQPQQGHGQSVIEAAAPLAEWRNVRSSNGQLEYRPVIVTSISLLGYHWKTEITLSNRTEMGFRMLLGREALRGRFGVDPGRSFVGGPEPKTAHEKHLEALRKRRRKSPSTK